DFLLQSGFGSGGLWNDDPGEPDRGMDALLDAMLAALIDSAQLTPEMLQVLRGETTGDPAQDKELERQLSDLLDQIVQRLIDEWFLKSDSAPQMPAGDQSLFGPGGQAREAAEQVQFGLTEKGMDFLGYKTLKGLLGSIGKSSFGAHDTAFLANGGESESASRPYEFGDPLTLDVPATLTNAIARGGLKVPL